MRVADKRCALPDNIDERVPHQNPDHLLDHCHDNVRGHYHHDIVPRSCVPYMMIPGTGWGLGREKKTCRTLKSPARVRTSGPRMLAGIAIKETNSGA